MKDFLHHDIPSLAVGKAVAGTVCAAAFFLIAGLPSEGAAAQQFFCTFATSPTDCDFIEEKKEDGMRPSSSATQDGNSGSRHGFSKIISLR
jgi:hypothetical protein